MLLHIHYVGSHRENCSFSNMISMILCIWFMISTVVKPIPLLFKVVTFLFIERGSLSMHNLAGTFKNEDNVMIKHNLIFLVKESGFSEHRQSLKPWHTLLGSECSYFNIKRNMVHKWFQRKKHHLWKDLRCKLIKRKWRLQVICCKLQNSSQFIICGIPYINICLNLSYWNVSSAIKITDCAGWWPQKTMPQIW